MQLFKNASTDFSINWMNSSGECAMKSCHEERSKIILYLLENDFGQSP